METLLRIVVSLVVALLLLGCTDETLDASYPTASDALADGAVERGWIPAWIPSTATDIHEVHNLDSNQSALSFTLPQAAWRPPEFCRRADGGELPEPAFDRSWLPSSQEMAVAYDFYSCPSDLPGPILETVAVQRGGNRVLHWRVFAR